MTGAAIHLGQATARGLKTGLAPPIGPVAIPLAMLNRHGLVAGATGTGKTKTLQIMAEQAARAGCAVFVADLKGDLAGLAMPGEASPVVLDRASRAGVPDWTPAAAPGVRFVSLTGEWGRALRAPLDSFGPLLLARVLELNATQADVVAIAYREAERARVRLATLADLRATLAWLVGDGRERLPEYVAKATVGVVMRRLAGLEHQGGDRFFGMGGRGSGLVADLLTPGRLTVLELADVQDRPAVFSAFMAWLLVRLWRELPEVGDGARPRLLFFFDEAHALFAGAPPALVAEVERTTRLIRSRGVGVFYVTQHPADLPRVVLAQLGHRILHALRAATPEEERSVKAAARTLPKSLAYDVESIVGQLAIGEALVSVLDAEGVQREPVPTLIAPPRSRMGPPTQDEWAAILARQATEEPPAATPSEQSASAVLGTGAAAQADEQRTPALQAVGFALGLASHAMLPMARVTLGAVGWLAFHGFRALLRPSRR